MINVSPVGCNFVNLTRGTPIVARLFILRWLHLFQDFRCVIGCFIISLIVTTSQTVSRAADTTSASVQDVCVDHCRANVFVTKQFLNSTNVVTIGQQVGSEGMAKGVTGDSFRETGLFHRCLQ